MNLGIGLGVTNYLRVPTVPLDPDAAIAALFSSGEEGAWYDPSDLTTLYQDAAGTTPVTGTGQPVGRIEDKSGNGNHATQSTSTARPTLQSSGGLYYLDFDGVDDNLRSSSFDLSGVTVCSMWAAFTKESDTRSFIFRISNAAVSAGMQIEHSGTIFGGNNGSYKGLGRRTRNNQVADFSGFVTPADYLGTQTNVAYVSFDRSVSGNSAVAFRVDGAVPASNITTSTGANSINPADFEDQTIDIGSATSQVYFSGRIYGLILRAEANTTAEIEATETYLASKSGVTLP